MRADARLPSVQIDGDVTMVDDIASFTPDENWEGEGEFWVDIVEEPEGREECDLGKPTYKWKLTPDDWGAYIPAGKDEEQSIPVKIGCESDWGQTYTLRVIETWEYIKEGVVVDKISATNTIQIAALKLDSINYWWDPQWEPISDTIYILKDSTVKFKAIPIPAGVSWPSGTPIWGGTSGASGDGETKSVTFSSTSSSLTDYKTVTVQCGNTKTVNVVVYELKGIFTPQDNFDGRSQDRYGVGEKVDLSFTATPSVTLAQIGGLKWKRASGTGLYSLPSDNNGTGTYGAKDEPGNITLKLEVLGGPSKGFGPSYDKEVKKPDDVYFMRWPHISIYHINGEASIGFVADVYLLPKDVSFQNIEIMEGTCESEVTGYFVGKAHNHLQWKEWGQVDQGNSSKGCQVIGADHVQSPFKGTNAPPYSDGTFIWAIPWYFRIEGNPVEFTTVDQRFTIDDTGKMTAEKGAASDEGDASAEAELDDPTQEYDPE
jgi:hypothetical protein